MIASSIPTRVKVPPRIAKALNKERGQWMVELHARGGRTGKVTSSISKDDALKQHH